VTTNLAHLQKNADLAGPSAALRGLVFEKSGRMPEAVAAWSENLATNIPPERQREAILKIAALAAAQKNLPAAEAALKNVLDQFSDAAVAALARLTLGELYLQDYEAQPSSNILVAAQAQFDQLLVAGANGPLAGKAFLDRGWCGWLAGKYPESFVDFKRAAEQLAFSEDLAVAKFKMGDALFAQTNFASARENYTTVLTQFDSLPAVGAALGDRALYQILRASLELKDEAAAEQSLQQLLQRYPQSELVDKSLLLAGEGFSDLGSPKNARGVFEKFQKQFPESALRPQVALAAARTFEWEQDWSAAITAYEKWCADFPTNVLRSQVDFALAQAHFRAGNEALAFGQFTNFVAQYSADPLAPTAQWWVADHFFRAGDYVNAEKNYQLLAQNWPANELVYQARLMAGMAAVNRQGFSDAAGYFLKLTTLTNCPAPIFTKAMFAYGSVLTRMDSPDTNRPFLNYETATNVFAQICAANPTNETGALAWSEIGDCDIQLGAFDAATNAFAQVVNSPYAGAGLRSRAQVGLGLTLDKKAALLPVAEQKPLLQLALEYYRDVFYADDVGADFWMKKAGLSALPLMVAVGEDDRDKLDKFFNRLEKKLPQLKDTLEKKRAAFKK
jgi:TolA-binding protein